MIFKLNVGFLMKDSKNFATAVILSGILTGIISSIPGLSALNFCCLWFLLGGFWTSYLIWYKHREITVGQGVGGGFLAGLITAFIYSILNTVNLSVSSSDKIAQIEDILSQNQQGIPPEMMDVFTELINSPVVSFLLFFATGILIFPIAMAIGGLVGALIFKGKSKSEEISEIT